MSFLPHYIIIHHSATAPDASLQDIRAYHIEKGMDDVGYHFVIDSHGSILPGRSLMIPGAHARGLNADSIGICCIGDFSEIPPTPRIVESLISLISQLRKRFTISPKCIIGHRDVRALSQDATPTVCPGDGLYALIERIRERSEPQITYQEVTAEHCTLYEAEVSRPSLEWIGEWRLRVSGSLSNKGMLTWDNRKSDEPSVTLSITIQSASPPSIQKKIDVPILNQMIAAGDSGLFTGEVDLSLFGPGTCVVKFTVHFSDGTSSAADQETIQIPRSGSTDDPRFQADTIITAVERKQGFLLTISGQVKNTGLLAWNAPGDDPLYPIRIGLIVHSDDQTVPAIIDEVRYEFPSMVVQPREQVSFKFELNSYALPPGNLTALVSVVRERDFWFHQRGSRPARTEILIEKAPHFQEVFRREYCLPASAQEASILYIGPTLPLFDRDTGGRRLYAILSALRAMGSAVTVAYENPGVGVESSKYIEALENLGITVVMGPLSFLSSCTPGQFSSCILGWYSSAAKYISIVKQVLPAAKVILDSVDIHWVRESRGVSSGELTLTKEELLEHKAKEISVYSASDEVWVVSHEERNFLLSELPDAPTKVISLMTEPLPSLFKEESNDIVFVGSFNHPPNHSAALWGYEICEAFRKKSGRVFRYYIVGVNPPPAIQSLHDGVNTIVTGFVEDLGDLYRSCRAFLAPIRYGAGVKGKITDAASLGLPILTTALGNEGISLVHEKSGYICETTGEFTKALEALFADPSQAKILGEEGRCTVVKTTGKKEALPLLHAAISARPVVVAIITYNRCDLLRRCLETLIANTVFPNWKVVVYSNGCTDDTAPFMESLQLLHPSLIDFIRSESNDFFVRPNNQIIQRHPEADIVLLNNDTELPDGRWLMELQQAAYTAQDVGASGCLILDSAGLISEAGGRITSEGMGINIGRGSTRHSPLAKAFRYVGFASGCCLYMRRDMIDRYGPLDEEMHPLYYEDVEWQFRLHTFGVKTLWTPRAYIIHLEGSTAGTDLSTGMKKYQEINRLKFLEKFRGADLDTLNE